MHLQTQAGPEVGGRQQRAMRLSRACTWSQPAEKSIPATQCLNMSKPPQQFLPESSGHPVIRPQE
jgi:hypothetical protein